MPRLLNLPIEILILIGQSVEYDWNISAFFQVNSHLYSLLKNYAYQHNQRYFQGSLLAWAAMNGSELVARKMLDAGTDPLTCHNGKRTAMSLAVMNGHASIIQLFLDRGIPCPVAILFILHMRRWQKQRNGDMHLLSS